MIKFSQTKRGVKRSRYREQQRYYIRNSKTGVLSKERESNMLNHIPDMSMQELAGRKVFSFTDFDKPVNKPLKPLSEWAEKTEINGREIILPHMIDKPYVGKDHQGTGEIRPEPNLKGEAWERHFIYWEEIPIEVEII